MNVKDLLLGAIEWLRSRVTAMKSEKGRWKRERLMRTLAYIDYRTQCPPLVCLFTDVYCPLAEGGR